MTSIDSNMTMGLDRLNALFTWWGVPNASWSGNVETQMKRFQTFASDLQKTYGEAYSQQMQAVFTANERLGRSLQDLMHCRQPQDIVAAESEMLTTLLEGASLQAKTWIELTQKVQDCCTAMAREEVTAISKRAEKASPKIRVESVQPSAKPTSKHPEHA